MRQLEAHEQQPGKYDDICASAKEASKAEGVILIIIGGEHGHGFSVQAPEHVLLRLPKLLRTMADDIQGK